MEDRYKRSSMDKFLIRAKDIMLLATSCIPMVILVSKFWMLPGLVDAHAEAIRIMQVNQTAQHEEIVVLKQGIKDIKDILIAKL